MDQSIWISTGLLIIAVGLTSQSHEAEEQPVTGIWVGVEVDVDQGHNSSETSCEAPKKPSNGGYVSKSDVYGHRHNTGDTIQYYCHRGHRLIGQAFRTCNGTAKTWEPDEPNCQPEYIGDLLSRLNVFEDKLNAIEDKVFATEQRLTFVENNTLKIGDKISAIDNKVLENDNKSAMDSRLSSVVANVSSIESSPGTTSKFRQHLVGCPNDTEAIDEYTLLRCISMQLSVRNGESVSESKWVIKELNFKVPPSASTTLYSYYSPPFYPTVPGYKLRLRGNIYYNRT